MFGWAVENELVPPNVYHGLQAVRGSRRGRSTARETEPVGPVPQAYVDVVLPVVSRQVAAMIRFQLLTACRPSEACSLRACDIDMSGRIWIYRPQDHKTAHHGRGREIYIGPKCQELIRPWLTLDTQAYLFSSADAERERNHNRHASRKTPLSCGNRPGVDAQGPKGRAGEQYSVHAYRRAIHRACDVASDDPKPGYHRGAEKMRGNLSQLRLRQFRYLSLREADQNPRDKAWNLP